MVKILICATLTQTDRETGHSAVSAGLHATYKIPRTLEPKRFEEMMMFNSPEARVGQFNPAQRGYHAVYRDNEVNHCPGCGRTHWYLGRVLAECAFCSTALPLQESFRSGPAAPVIRRSRPAFAVRDAA